MKHHPPHHRRRDARLAAFVDRDRIDALLAPWIHDDDDRAFVLRCLLDEGPPHHRGSNYVLLALLGELVDGSAGPRPGNDVVRVPMHLPPHLVDERDEHEFPLDLPRAPLARIAPGDDRAQKAMLDCLTDGPPQHALANAAMLCLLDALLRARVP